MTDVAELPNCPLTYADLRAIGFTSNRLVRLVRAGILRRVLQGVYVRTEVPESLELRVACAALVIPAGHVVVDRTAAWLHGVDVLTYAEHEILPPIETCASRGSHPTERSDLRGRSRDLAQRDITSVGGIRVTTPLRTALDLGCNLHLRDAYATLNQFARTHGVTRRMLTAELPRFRRRRGVVQLRALVPLVDARVESVRESWVLLEIVGAGLPAPEPQFWIEVDDVPTYRLDFAYPKARICVEYDGWEAHERTSEQRLYDQRRRQWLRDHGWTVIVIRNGDFTGDGLDRWIGELKEALRAVYTNRRW